MHGLYIHIPFCEHICVYCDFCKRVPKPKMIVDYLQTLKTEYLKLNKTDYETIYIGGGTPSMLSIFELTLLLEMLKENNALEYTIEINPESYTHEKGLLLKKYGVNRVSLGVQTFNETILKTLNRKHSNQDVYFVINDLINLGITNISLDLMFALPNQTMADVINDLTIVSELPIKHLSYYSLILEEKTILYKQYLTSNFLLNELETDMYLYIIDELKKQGFQHYEVSNFSKEEKYQSLHNKLYWNLSLYDAIGAGAHGFNGEYRYHYDRNIEEFIKNPLVLFEKQTAEMLIGDFMIFSLRLMSGVNLTLFQEKFKLDPLTHFSELSSFINNGFLEIDNNFLKVTQKGLLFLNQIELVFI